MGVMVVVMVLMLVVVIMMLVMVVMVVGGGNQSDHGWVGEDGDRNGLSRYVFSRLEFTPSPLISILCVHFPGRRQKESVCETLLFQI